MRISTMLSDMDEIPSIQIGDEILQFEIDEPSDFSVGVAERELRETPDIKEASVEKLRLLLKEETDLHVPIDNSDWLIRFLRPCKFYPESARDLIKRYYSFKVKHADMYDNLLPSNEKNIFEHNILTVYPHRDQLGRRMLSITIENWKHKEATLDELFKGCVLLLEAAMVEHNTQINGAVVIFDMHNLSLQQVWQFTPQFAKRLVDWLQESVPVRIKALHVINQPKIFNIVFALFKPFLTEKLRSRIYFHGVDRQSLHKHIDPDCLPPKFGGTRQTETKITGAEWYELLMKCDKEYRAINSYGYNKNGIPKKKK